MKAPGTPDSKKWIAVIGDQMPGFEPQDAIRAAVGDAAGFLGFVSPEVRWISTELLEAEGSGVLDSASGVWCAPGSPFRSLEGALSGIRRARESRIPFLGTCAGFQHGVIEYARNVLGHNEAAHAEYESSDQGDLFIEDLLCSLVGKTMEVEVVDSDLLSVYGDRHPKERYYCRFGLNPTCRSPLEEGGLIVAGVDAEDGDVRIMRLVDHPFFVLTLFVPQTSSSPDRPHPLILGFLRATLAKLPTPGILPG
jgi:CTP synthase (UTP-ammonia lyase)